MKKNERDSNDIIAEALITHIETLLAAYIERFGLRPKYVKVPLWAFDVLKKDIKNAVILIIVIMINLQQ